MISSFTYSNFVWIDLYLFDSPETMSNHTIQNTVIFSKIDELLKKENSADILVGYVMTTNSYVLIGSTTSESYNNTKTAFSATNTYIKESAKYIQKMKITTDSTVYDSNNGVIISIKFWKYGTVPPNTFSTDPLEVGSLAWTIVSVATPTTTTMTADSTVTSSTTETQSTATFSTSDSDNISENLSMTESVLGLAATSLILNVAILAGVFYTKFNSGPLSKQAEMK
jgi:hypothetical protein